MLQTNVEIKCECDLEQHLPLQAVSFHTAVATIFAITINTGTAYVHVFCYLVYEERSAGHRRRRSSSERMHDSLQQVDPRKTASVPCLPASYVHLPYQVVSKAY